MPTPRTRSAICLGCGCACDDIEPVVSENHVISADNACPLGARWFGEGNFPSQVQIDGQPAALDDALDQTAARLLRNPASLLILIGDDASIETHRGAIALADWLGATIEGLAAETVASGLLAAARRGRVSGTLGELRHRADLVLWWGCDPGHRYPRFIERFIDAPSRFVEQRRQIAIDIGDATGPPSSMERVEIHPRDELDIIGGLRGHLAGHFAEPPTAAIKTLVGACQNAASIAILYDAEPSGSDDHSDQIAETTWRAESLLLLAQQLHQTRRAAVWGLRAGGNRNGFEAVLSWQTGFFMSVDFGKGYPEYIAHEPVAERLARGRYKMALTIGTPDSIPAAIREQLAGIDSIAIGPFASQADFDPRIGIDTGRVGIHEAGLVLRMDDVPLETPAFLEHPHSADQIIQRLAELVSQRMWEAS